MTRRPVVYHIISAGRRQVSAASDLVMREGKLMKAPDLRSALGISGPPKR